MLSKVHPGKIIGQIYNYQLGSGTFRKDDNIHSSLLGDIEIDNSVHPPKISVVKKENLIKSQSINYIPKIGDDVYCRVTKVTKYFTNCEIIATNSQKVNSPISASIRKEGVKDDFKEFDMFECFIPGDIIFAKIISTEMTNAIYISTTDLNYGVVFAKSLLSNELMMPVSFDKMLCLDSGLYEKRKVAKPNIN